MSKATPADLLAENFVPSDFGIKTDPVTDWEDYAQPLLDEQAMLVEERVGTATYNSADPLIANHVSRAERFMAASELWCRRMNQVESDTVLGGEDPHTTGTGYKRYKLNAESYATKASAEIAALPSATVAQKEVTSAPAFGSVNTTHFRTLT